MRVIKSDCDKHGHLPGKSGEWTNRCTRCGNKIS